MLFRPSNLRYFIFTIAVIIFTFLQIEFMYEKQISYLCNLIFILSYLFFLFKDESKALFLILGYYILIPIFPRSILDDYTLLDQGIGYYTLHSITFGPINLLLLLTLMHAAICVFKYKLNKMQINYIGVCFALIIISLFVNIGYSHGFLSSPKYNSFSVVKPFIYMLIGAIFFSKNRPGIVTFLIFCSMILGYRVMFFGIGDIFIFDNFRLYFGLSPYLTLSIYVMLIYNRYNLKFYHHIGFILSLFYFSRALIVISLVLIVLATIKTSKKTNLYKLKLLGIITSFILIIPTILYNFNYRLYRFFIWKTNILKVFNNDYEMSGSGKIRFVENKNVIHEISQKAITFFFGKGINGTYNFNTYPLNISGVGLESYSSDQLSSGIYYSTHNFISFFLLKIGIIGLLLYIGSMVITIKTAKRFNIIILLVIVLNFLYNLWVVPILAIFYFNFFNFFTKNHKF